MLSKTLILDQLLHLISFIKDLKKTLKLTEINFRKLGSNSSTGLPLIRVLKQSLKYYPAKLGIRILNASFRLINVEVYVK